MSDESMDRDDQAAEEQPEEPDEDLSLDESLWEESQATSDEDVQRDTFSSQRQRKMRRAYS